MAVRDGFLSAYFQQDPAQRPRIRVYDVAGQDPGSTYLRAVQDGAQFATDGDTERHRLHTVVTDFLVGISN